MPVTIPEDDPTVAIEADALLHVPSPVLAMVCVLPTQTLTVPKVLRGTGLTVRTTTCTAEPQLLVTK